MACAAHVGPSSLANADKVVPGHSLAIPVADANLAAKAGLTVYIQLTKGSRNGTLFLFGTLYWRASAKSAADDAHKKTAIQQPNLFFRSK